MVSGCVVGPTVSAQPVVVRRSARTVAEVLTSKPPPSPTRPGSRPMPPGSEAKTGAVEAGTAAACSSRLPRRAMASSWGTAAAAEMCRAWPAYTPPRRGSTSRSTTSSPSRAATRSPTETSSPTSPSPSVSAAARASPSRLSTPLAASWSRSNGTPISERGRSRRAPCDQTPDVAAVGCTTSRAQLAHQVDPLRAARQHRLGPDVDREPGDLRAAQLAADLRGALQQEDVATGGGQAAGRDQSRDSPAHDHHVPRHAQLSLGCPVWTPT